MTRLTTDVTNIQNAYQMILRMFVRAPLSIIFAMGAAFLINGRIATVYLVAVIILAVFLVLIMNLITRFYDVQDGKIRYDGININKIRKEDLRHSLGIVLQDTHLFTGTVSENIRFGKLDATDEEVQAAARLANADGFIERLPEGYDTMLSGDGANLSQGQRQLLAIARAAIADPPVLILDEATSSIDSRTEKIVQEGMDRLMRGRTTFVIAHRLSTIQNSDCIMALKVFRRWFSLVPFSLVSSSFCFTNEAVSLLTRTSPPMISDSFFSCHSLRLQVEFFTVARCDFL